jgi:hypothetical protein
MSLGSVGGMRSSAPPEWVHEAPTRPNNSVSTLAQATTPTAPPPKAEESPQAEDDSAAPTSASVVDRLSDPAQWFDDATPPPVPSLRPQAEPPPPSQMRRRRVGEKLVTFSMAMSGVILLAATVVRIHAALGADHPPTLGSSPATAQVALAGDRPANLTAPTEALRTAEPAPTTGELQLGAPAPGRRVVVDGRPIREPSSSIQLPCGPHTVRFGYAGKPKAAVVPCGGSVTVAP